MNACYERARAANRWREANRGAPQRKAPKPVSWLMLHRDCDPNATSTAHFRVPDERLRSERQLLVQTLMLAPKYFFPHSDWRHFIKKILRANGGL
jgi:hypothetical protein